MVIPKIHNLTSKRMEDYLNISFNWGEYNILLDIPKNIGWIQYRERYIIPISSIL